MKDIPSHYIQLVLPLWFLALVMGSASPQSRFNLSADNGALTIAAYTGSNADLTLPNMTKHAPASVWAAWSC